MPLKNNREYRSMVLEAVRTENEEEQKNFIVTGYATTFNEPYTLFSNENISYREQVAPEAFENTDMSDVIMQYNHAGRVFARLSNGTLRIQPDEKGLLIEADLGGTEQGRQLYEEIRGGYTTKMSFGFIVGEEKEDRNKAEDGRTDFLRTITSISKLFDVSAVSLPANEGTSIGVVTRSKIDGVIEEVQAERLEAERLELEKRRTEIKAKAIQSGGKNE